MTIYKNFTFHKRGNKLRASPLTGSTYISVIGTHYWAVIGVQLFSGCDWLKCRYRSLSSSMLMTLSSSLEHVLDVVLLDVVVDSCRLPLLLDVLSRR